MKKLLAIVLAALMLVPTLVACKSDETASGAYKVAMITDCGNITDESFNQATYEACQEYCTANKIDFQYFQPADDSNTARVSKIEEAIDKGHNIIVMPGYLFAEAIKSVQDQYKDVKFIALDVSEDNIKDCYAAGEEAHLGDNVYCAVYKEELCGYMAGYAAVKLGYKHLGFLGGIAVPAVIRYGYGFVQGCEAAAAEMGISEQVIIEYIYANTFSAAPGITARMDEWYQTFGVEVVFACGGGIYASAVDAAKKVNGKIIGVDVDQAATINKLADGKNITVTSAMKGLGATVKSVLGEIIEKENWKSFGGKYDTLGLISGDDPELNYVQLPMKSTQWGDAFTQDDYKALVNKMFKGEITVSADTQNAPDVTINVNYYDNIN